MCINRKASELMKNTLKIMTVKLLENHFPNINNNIFDKESVKICLN